MPRSFAFANNKGGSGKTFLLTQAAAEMASAFPDLNVLVIDLSLYSDTSCFLMGGLHRDTVLAATRGLEATLANTTAETRAEGMLRDLMSNGSPASLFGAVFGSRHGAAETDLTKYMVSPAKWNPRIPENLRLIASAGAESWRSDGDRNDDAVWWTSDGDEWQPAAVRMQQAIDRLSGEWVVLIDTDHLAASPLSKLALGAARATIVPLSLDEGDFNRMFSDPTGNALLNDVMPAMASRGVLSAPITKFVFTKLSSQANTPVKTRFGIHSPIKPAAAAQNQMDTIACALLEAFREAPPELQACLSQFDPGCTSADFAQRYFTTFKTVSDVALNASKLNGAPVCTMSHDDCSLGASRPDPKVLGALQDELDELVRVILGSIED